MARQEQTYRDSGEAFRPPARKERTPLRDNLEYFAALILIVLLLRQVVVEAFRIRHGSMAPTLVGDHREVRCPNCEWVFEVGEDEWGSVGQVECGNCRYHWDGASIYDSRGERIAFRGPDWLRWLWSSAHFKGGAPLSTTDAANRVHRGASRIFVNKFIYGFRRPHRWEVVVFVYPYHTIQCKVCRWKGEVRSLEDAVCPDCGSRDFNVTTKNFIKRVVGLPNETVSLRDGDVYDNGVIARKPREIQEDLWFHVFDSGFMPQVEVQPTWDLGNMAQRWTRGPAQAALTVDARGVGEPVVAAFGRPIVDFYSYDGLSYETAPRSLRAAGRYEVGDCRIMAKVCVLDHDPGGGAIIFGINDAGHRFTLSVAAGGPGRAVLQDGGLAVRDAGVPALGRQQSRWLALENYDDRIVGKVGGSEVLSYDYEGRSGGQRRVQFGARGAKVLWERIVIERDIYYESAEAVPGVPPAYELGKGEYFVLGDNSPASSDSRRWRNPAVPEENLIGEAFFVFWPIHQMKWFSAGRAESAVPPKRLASE